MELTIIRSYKCKNIFADELGYLVDAIVRDDKIASFDGNKRVDLSYEDKHILSRLLLLLNPTTSRLSDSGNSNNNGNKRKNKKPIINVVEGVSASNNNDDKRR